MGALRIIGAAAGLASIFAQTAAADGYFLQGDAGSRTQSFIASGSHGSLNYGMNFSNYEDGRSGAVSLTYAFPLADDAVLKVGPSIGVEQKSDEENDLEAGFKLSLERYTATSFGSTYLLTDLSSVHQSWFLLGQVTFAPHNFGIELSRGGSDNYHETTLAFQKRLADSPFSLRIGYKLTSEEVFAGFSVNTF
ncbi:hypothetical protein [Paracoccus jeotgali]|uniref:hypothetical protein n=1 Tax=Paracoccus jeotgali TaxID=2065379 RepID=UPI0028B21C60|nr:hypothetical protein [Paracoccus jeotgali]